LHVHGSVIPGLMSFYVLTAYNCQQHIIDISMFKFRIGSVMVSS